MSSDVVIRAAHLGKCFRIYDKPRDRLLQAVRGRIASLTGFAQAPLYREHWALKGVSFEVRAGECIGFLGRNGSGKSTLLQIICGTLAETAGSIDVHGRIAALLELGAGFNMEFSGRENVYLNAAILGLTRAEIDAVFPQIEAFAEIGDFIDQPVKTYSSGMFVRLAFSVAVHVDPKLLVVDEALAVGDARFQSKCLDRIKALKDGGATILFVSHDVGAVRTLCDRAIWLDKGVMRLEGDVLSVTARYMKFLFDDDEEGCLATAEAGDLQKPEHHRRAISHWGEAMGCIEEIDLLDASNMEPVSVIKGEASFVVRIKCGLPDSSDVSSLGIALSIKNIAGSDLIVSTTWDSGYRFQRDAGGDVLVEFRMTNQLAPGNYMMALAVEDRSGATVRYLEYIEGGLYFSSIWPGTVHGMFVPSIDQAVSIISQKVAPL